MYGQYAVKALFALLLSMTNVMAADFSVDGSKTILRQLQYCTNCGSALLVTRLKPGVIVRCPDCGFEQPRISNRFVLTQIYQACTMCMMPIDTSNHTPGETVHCLNCQTRQTVSRDAFAAAEYTGPGFAPDAPPGSNRKRLLFSPDTPDAHITPIPFESPFASDSAEDTIITSVHDYTRTNIPIPDIPQLKSSGIDEPLLMRPAVIDVPVVSVDLFPNTEASRPKPPPNTIIDGTISGKLIARVNGSPIYTQEVNRIISPLMAGLRARPPQGINPDEREKALRHEILERLIDRELALQEAVKLKRHPDPELVRTREAELINKFGKEFIDAHREAERDVILADLRQLITANKTAPNPGAVREYYKQHTADWMQPRMIAIAPLVVFADRSGKQDSRSYLHIGDEIIKHLETGSKFDILQSRYDEFGSVAGSSAQPVLLPEAAYATYIASAAATLRKGAVFGPLFLEGLVLFGKITDERPASPTPFEQIEKQIRTLLENQSAEKSFEEWLVDLRRNSVVEFYE